MAAAASLLAAPRARADWTARAEPAYSLTETTTRDAAGTVSHVTSHELTQRYRLALSDELAPLLRLDAGGNYELSQGWLTTDGASSTRDALHWNGYGRLSVGGPGLSGAFQFERLESGSSSRAAGVTLRAPTQVRDTFLATAAWRPSELPSLDLRASRTFQYDTRRVLSDLTTDEAYAASAWRPSRNVDLSYSLRYSNPHDALADVDTRELLNSGRVSWSDKFLDQRLTTFVSYSAGLRQTRTVARGATGSVATPAFPTLFLSAIEKFSETPERIQLRPNPALSGDSGGTGLDLGFAPALAGDLAYRDLGAQFGGASSAVNTIWVFVDRDLPSEIAAAIPWAVYKSDDNQTWTPVPIVAPVQFGPFLTRFEITIERTQATYLKVVSRPISTALLTPENRDRFSSILVTKLQLLLTTPAQEARGSSTVANGALNAVARYQLTRAWNLAYDTALFLSHASAARTIWNVLNGLSASQRLAPSLGLNARVDRTDSQTIRGHEAISRASAGLTADPLPTLGATLGYNAQVREAVEGVGYSNGLSGFARAALYEGVDLTSGASFTTGRSELSQSTRSTTLTAGAMVTPNRTATLNANYTFSSTAARGGGRPGQSDSAARVEANATYTPFPALSTSAGLSRFVSGRSPATLLTFAGSFSPFQGGDLLLRFSYNDTLDVGADLRTRIWGPGLRWNLRGGTYVDLSYTFLVNRTPALETDSRTLFATLAIALK